MRAPHVISGHAFMVKVRTCVTLEGRSGARLLVTAAVEWTDKSDFKEIIERAAYEGLKRYYQDMVAFIQQDIDAYKRISLEYEGISREECHWLNFTCPDAYDEYPEQEQQRFEAFHAPNNHFDFEHAFENLQHVLRELNQQIRRIEKRVIDGEGRVAELEAENSHMRRALKDIREHIADGGGF